jgi:hypothetical protein
MNYKTREDWLNAAAAALYAGLFAQHEVPTPQAYRISCGWPAGARKAIGQCFPTHMSKDRHNEIFVSPLLDDPVEVLAVLIHEMIHASDDCRDGHKGRFRRWAKAVGLEGKMTATVASDTLKSYLVHLIETTFGSYPHATLKRGGVLKKQTTRMLKIECWSCGFTARTSGKWVDQMSLPAICPICEEHELVPDGVHPDDALIAANHPA